MKYVIKRVIIAVLSFLAIMLIKQNVFAQVYTANTGGLSTGVNYWTGYADMNASNTFVGLGHGTLTFNFSIYKLTGLASDYPLTARTVYAVNGSASYICNIGSIINNSGVQYSEEIYSASCPFDADLSGLTRIRIVFTSHNPNTTTATFQLVIGGLITFVSDNTVFLPTMNQSLSSIDSNINYLSQQLVTINGNITTGNNATSSVNSSIQSQTNAINNQTTAINTQTTTINNTLTDDSTTQAETTGGGFFNNFSSNSHGISGIVTAPLRLLQSFTTANCQPLQFQLPFVHNNVSLQCMRPVISSNFPTFFTLFQLISTGVIGYMVMINIFAKVHDLQDPNNDRIEVLSL